jgi:hypothetical protein
MAQIINFPGHRKFNCTCGGNACEFCNDGLWGCKVCSGIKETGSLPTHCPGAFMSLDEIRLVSSGWMDYDIRRGGWVNKSSIFDSRGDLG